jgi:hypothetical protein
MLVPRPLGGIACSALLRLGDDSVWMFRTEGSVWTPERIGRLGAALSRALDTERFSRGFVHSLARALNLPTLVMLSPCLDGVDPDQWQIERVAQAFARRERSTRASARIPFHAQTAIIEKRLLEELGAAVTAFVRALDATALGAARRLGHVEAALYNFFVTGPQPKYRQQLAETFPCLVSAAAHDCGDGAGAHIRHAVDLGMPLVDALSQRWGVKRSAVRALAGKPGSLIGSVWESNPRGLVQALDRFAPLERPGNDPASWLRFTDVVGLANRRATAEPSLEPLIQTWVQRATRRGWLGEDANLIESWLSAAGVRRIGVLRAALVALFDRTIEPSRSGRSQPASPSLGAIVDRQLGAFAPHRLIALAELFEHQLRQASSELSATIGVLEGSSFWPLFPGEFLSSDRSRKLRALVTSQALEMHGQALMTCLSGRFNARYSRACSDGKCFIVAAYDSGSDKPMSAADLRVTPNLAQTGYDLSLVEHSAYGNSLPSLACRTAMTELLAYCRTPAVQKHLVEGARVQTRIHDRFSACARQAAARLLPIEHALRATLGANLLEAIRLQALRARFPEVAALDDLMAER